MGGSAGAFHQSGGVTGEHPAAAVKRGLVYRDLLISLKAFPQRLRGEGEAFKLVYALICTGLERRCYTTLLHAISKQCVDCFRP